MTVTAPRREQLLAAAAALFAERGYHAVGIDDIGAAAGITGPGVYRHFPSKAALLEALCDRAMSSMLDGARRIAAEHDEPLEALVDLHAGFTVEHRTLLGVYLRDSRALDDDVRRSLRRRQRAYERLWRTALAARRAELPATDVAVLVTAALALLNAAAFADAGVPAGRLRELLTRSALAVLLG